MSQVILKPRKARPFYARHPWVLDSAIARVEGDPADGDIVDLLGDKGKFIARGVFNSCSRIRVRLYTWDADTPLDDAFWRRRIEAAVQFRSQLGYDDPQGAARLIFSEGDGLSGLIVDRYADYLAIQVTAQAMAVRLPQIVPMLVEMVHPKGIMIRTERGVSRTEGIELRDGPYWGAPPDGPILIVDNGLRYEIDLAEGQKTGFYLDQRENRVAAARYFRDRRVLDMFCYSGGFSMAASAIGGAREVLGVDTSQRAVMLAWANVQRNGLQNVRFQEGDGFETLESLLAAGERFGGVILDPPKFARSRSAVQRSPAGLPLAKPTRRLALGARRHLGHMQLFRPRHPRRLPLHARRRRPANPPRNPNPRPAWCLARSPHQRRLLGRGVFEVLHLPGGVAPPPILSSS